MYEQNGVFLNVTPVVLIETTRL